MQGAHLFQAPFRAGIHQDTYQLLPLRKALRLPRVNLLIADDLPLGRGPSWIVDLLKRKPPKLAAVALANKMARIAWKLMATGDSYAAKSAPASLVGVA